MQSMEDREFIGKSGCQILFRHLRNGVFIDKTELATICNLSWPSINNIQKDACRKGIIIPSSQKLGAINPDYAANFAGIHISDKTIDLSIINFSGKVIKTMQMLPPTKKSFFESLVSLFRELDFSNITALSISSDEFYKTEDKSSLKSLHFCDDIKSNLVFYEDYIRYEVPETVETYFAKTCFAYSVKCLDMNASELSEVTVVITHVGNKVYLNFINDDIITKKSSNFHILELTGEREFYDEIILPVWKFMKPDKIIVISSDDKIKDERNLYEWKRRIWLYQRDWIKDSSPNIVALDFCPSESTALHAMYNYYGWKY